VKRILRVFAVLSATAMASALTISGASAGTVKPAVTGQPNTAVAAARTQVTPKPLDPYTFESADGGGFITGDTHGGDLYLGAGTVYTRHPKPGSYYALSASKYCWNAIPKATTPVGMDSCPSNDTNEWFKFVDYNGFTGIVQKSSGLYVTAVDGKIDLDPKGGRPDDQEWIMKSA
jgi:hypothetical protein